MSSSAQPVERLQNAPGPQLLERAVSASAPLLAGVSFALIALVLQVPSSRMPLGAVALFLLVLAGLSLVASIQAVFWDSGRNGIWAFWVRVFFDLGTVALTAAIGAMLAPRMNGLNGWRLAAILIAGLGLVGELIWTTAATVSELRRRVSTRRRR